MKCLCNLLVVLALLGFSGAGQGQVYPAAGSVVKVLVPFAPGSGTDVMARALVEALQAELKATMVVENRPGANGAVAAEVISKSIPDGNTIILGTSSAWSTNPWLMKQLPYDPINDFTPIARTTNFPFILAVSAASPIQSLDDFLKNAQSRKSPLTMGYGNATGQVAGAHLMKVAKFEAVPVAYKSTPPALVDLIGGQFDFMFVDMASSQAFVKQGKVRPIAVMADRRSELMPELPALGEKYPGFDFVAWGGLIGPKGLPQPVVAKLNAAVVTVLQRPEMKQKLLTLGLEAYPSTTKEFEAFVVAQLRIWGEQVQGAGMQKE